MSGEYESDMVVFVKLIKMFSYGKNSKFRVSVPHYNHIPYKHTTCILCWNDVVYKTY